MEIRYTRHIANWKLDTQGILLNGKKVHKAYCQMEIRYTSILPNGNKIHKHTAKWK
jgi:hypothetical protein